MQLDPAEKRSIWWKGALMGALKGAALGIAMGFISAVILFGLINTFPMVLGAMLPFVTINGSFTSLLMIAFTAVSTGIAGLFTGGNQAVSTYHQNKHNQRDEAKLIELDGRTRALEQEMTHSQQVQKILENGPRNATSFQVAEDTRKAEMPALHTIH